FSALKKLHPQEYGRVIAIVRKATLEGRPLADARSEAMSVLQPILLNAMPTASDEALLQFYSVFVEELEGFSKFDSRACEAYAKGDAKGYEFSSLGLELQTRDLEASARLMSTEGQYSGGRIDASAVAKELADVMAGA